MYEELVAKATITFEETSIADSWTMKKLKTGHYLITAPPNKPSAELLTHELLHVQLDLEGFKDHAYIVASILLGLVIMAAFLYRIHPFLSFADKGEKLDTTILDLCFF